MKFTTTTALVASALLLENAAGHVVKRASTTTTAATSSSTASSTGKRGLSYNVASYTNFFAQSGQNSQVSWAYNWGQTAGSGVNSALEFVPMLWSNDSSLTSTWATNAQAAIDSGSTALLAFNEPDLCVSGSACMDVPSAVAAYKKYMQPFAGKALLGSPAVSNGGAPDGLTWLTYFIGNCTDCTIDFVNIHWYSNHWAGVTYLEEQVEAARAMAGGRDIWITEFALDGTDDQTDAMVQEFIEDSVVYLDEQSDVARYAYFMDAAGILLNSAGTALSTDGVIFNNYTQVSSSTSSSSLATSSTSSSLSSTSSAGSLSTYTSSRTASSSVTAVSSSSLSSSTQTSSASSTKSSSSSSQSSTLVTSTKTSTSSTTKASSTSTKISTSSSSSTSKTSSKTSTASSTSTKTSTSSSSSTSKTSSSTTSATATSTGLTILSAYFADDNVTSTAKTAFTSSGNLVINTDNLLNELAISDPWYGTVKTLAVLYTLGNTTHIFVAAEQTGTYTLTPSSVTSASEVPGYAVMDGADVTIVGMVWGDEQISTKSVYATVYSEEATGWGFEISTSLFGVDGFWGHEKVGIIWYKNAQGVLKALVGREGTYVEF